MAENPPEDDWYENNDDELTDEELTDVARHLSDYTESGQREIIAELQQRGLPIPPEEITPKPNKSEDIAVLLAFFLGAVGMLYVGRFWQSLSLIYLCLVGGIGFGAGILEPVLSPRAMNIYNIVVLLAFVAIRLVVFPVWAYFRACELNRIE